MSGGKMKKNNVHHAYILKKVSKGHILAIFRIWLKWLDLKVNFHHSDLILNVNEGFGAKIIGIPCVIMSLNGNFSQKMAIF